MTDCGEGSSIGLGIAGRLGQTNFAQLPRSTNAKEHHYPRSLAMARPLAIDLLFDILEVGGEVELGSRWSSLGRGAGAGQSGGGASGGAGVAGSASGRGNGGAIGMTATRRAAAGVTGIGATAIGMTATGITATGITTTGITTAAELTATRCAGLAGAAAGTSRVGSRASRDGGGHRKGPGLLGQIRNGSSSPETGPSGAPGTAGGSRRLSRT